jgi:hypothetical protein
MEWLKMTLRNVGVWYGGIIIFIIWALVLGFILDELGIEPTENNPMFGLILSIFTIISYNLTALSLYHLGLKNLPNGERKAKYWVLIAYSLYHFVDENQKGPELFQKFNDFMLSLRI